MDCKETPQMCSADTADTLKLFRGPGMSQIRSHGCDGFGHTPGER